MAVTVPVWGVANRDISRDRQFQAGGGRHTALNRSEMRQPSVRNDAGVPRSSRAAQRDRIQARAHAASNRGSSATRYAAFAVFAVLVAAIVLFIPGLSAQASRGNPETPATSVVTVNEGDSLWTVAQRSMPHADTRSAVIELRKANNLRVSDLAVGQQLKVPNS